MDRREPSVTIVASKRIYVGENKIGGSGAPAFGRHGGRSRKPRRAGLRRLTGSRHDTREAG
jgi:hypothetical protein